MPVQRPKKNRSPEGVPDAGDPDRKRVLNVLAQRRYRQRRREKIAALEAQAKGLTPSSDTQQLAAIGDGFVHSESSDYGHTYSSVEHSMVEEIGRPTDSRSLSVYSFDQDPFDFAMMQDSNGLSHLPTPLPSSPSSPNFNFPLTPDGALLSIPTFSAMRTCLIIASALNVTNYIHDPSYLHVLPPSNPALAALPKNFHPIAAQLMIPHHPVLDILPWPSVREKLICMFSLPSPLRPPVAREEDEAGTSIEHVAALCDGIATSSHCNKQSGAIVTLLQDLDDYKDGGGLRVHGNSSTWEDGNELLEDSWEIGDHFYRKWWWCLDGKVIEVSNRRREERGLGRLRMSE